MSKEFIWPVTYETWGFPIKRSFKVKKFSLKHIFICSYVEKVNHGLSALQLVVKNSRFIEIHIISMNTIQVFIVNRRNGYVYSMSFVSIDTHQ